ncbi:MAG: PD40 domain-containing protein [Leptospiraceae bacterium]|nr:PD40 domain-containing protein [Leptospiraceae bacterium]
MRLFVLSTFALVASLAINLQACSSVAYRSSDYEARQQLLQTNLDQIPADQRPETTRQLERFQWRVGINHDLVWQIYNAEDTPAGRDFLNAFLQDTAAPQYFKWISLQKLTQIERDAGRQSEAVRLWERNRSAFPDHQDEVDEIIAILEAKSEATKIKDPGAGINSSAAEYSPAPSQDGKLLYFTAFDRPGGKGGEDIWVSDLQKGSTTNLDAINTPSYEYITSISADGNNILLLGNYTDSLGGGDLYLATRNSRGWQKPRHLSEPINSEHFDCDGVLTPDGKAILFTSDRPSPYYPYHKKNQDFGGDNWGNTDIYIAFIDKDMQAKRIVHLGPIINTPGAERTPWLHVDGRTLYFASNGFNGLGRMDIYKTERLDDSWQKWSRPVHTGKILNGIGNDWGLKLTARANQAWVAGQLTAASQESDLYLIEPLPMAARPSRGIAVIKGKVLDSSGKALQADIIWRTNQSAQSGQQQSNPADGTYYLSLPRGAKYNIHFQKQGYQARDLQIDLGKTTQFSEQTRLVTLQADPNQKANDQSGGRRAGNHGFNKSRCKQTAIDNILRRSPL